MNNFVKMDVAIEILADKMSKVTMQFYDTGSEAYYNEMNRLTDERDQLYSGDINVMDKIINVYGEELKNEWNNRLDWAI